MDDLARDAGEYSEECFRSGPLALNSGILAEVAALEKHIGTGDYSVRGVTGRGHLHVDLHLQRWDGEIGYRLFWRMAVLLWRHFRGSLMSEFRRKAEQ